MTETTPSVDEAFDQHDVTPALTPGQLVLLVVGVLVLLRIIRGARR